MPTSYSLPAPNHLPPPALGKPVSQPPVPVLLPPLQTLRPNPLLAKLLALGSLGGGGLNLDPTPCHGWLWGVHLGGAPARLESSPEGSPAVPALGSRWLLSSLPVSLCASPPLSVLTIAVLPTLRSLTPSASPGVSTSPSVCLCLRRMSRRAVCWRRWVWPSLRPGPRGDVGSWWRGRASVALFLVGPSCPSPAASPSLAVSCGLRALKHSLPPPPTSCFPFSH